MEKLELDLKLSIANQDYYDCPFGVNLLCPHHKKTGGHGRVIVDGRICNLCIESTKLLKLNGAVIEIKESITKLIDSVVETEKRLMLAKMKGEETESKTTKTP